MNGDDEYRDVLLYCDHVPSSAHKKIYIGNLVSSE